MSGQLIQFEKHPNNWRGSEAQSSKKPVELLRVAWGAPARRGGLAHHYGDSIQRPAGATAIMHEMGARRDPEMNVIVMPGMDPRYRQAPWHAMRCGPSNAGSPPKKRPRTRE